MAIYAVDHKDTTKYAIKAKPLPVNNYPSNFGTKLTSANECLVPPFVLNMSRSSKYSSKYLLIRDNAKK